MDDILTITSNPAIDLATTVDQVVAGPKLRCTAPRIDPGGGGVNVARAITKLGGHATALVAVGGVTGSQLCALLNAEGIPLIAVDVSGETRQSFAVTDQTSAAQYRFNLPGDILTQSDADLLLATITRAAPQNGLVVFSGSVAPGLPVDLPAQIMTAIAAKTDRFIVDTSKAALDHLIRHPTKPVYMLRIDQSEADEAAHQPMTDLDDHLSFAHDLINRGVAHMIVTGRGAQGSLLVAKDKQFFCHAPHVPVRSKIGAGDAFVGAMTLSLARGDRPEHALQWGVAAAGATVSTEGTALCTAEMTENLLSQSELEAL